MNIVTYDADGDYVVPDRGSQVRKKEATTVQIMDNPDGATIDVGCADDSDAFVAFPSSTITVGKVINHGTGTKLMVRLAGITTFLKIGYSV